jgi:protein gp37
MTKIEWADWARSIRDQCQASGVPFFFKKMGSRYKGETPEDLMIREFPKRGE